MARCKVFKLFGKKSKKYKKVKEEDKKEMGTPKNEEEPTAVAKVLKAPPIEEQLVDDAPQPLTEELEEEDAHHTADPSRGPTTSDLNNEATNRDDAATASRQTANECLDPKELRAQELHKYTVTKGLWREAYSKLEKRDLEKYEKFVLQGESTANHQTDPEDRQGQLQKVVREKLDDVQKPRLKIQVGKEEIVVRDQVKKIISKILQYKDVISATVSAEPHCALAWGGISALLPLVSSALSQSDTAVDGLHYISDLLVRFRVVEITYDLSPEEDRASNRAHDLCQNVRLKIVELYAQILKYQITLTEHFSRRQRVRFARGIATPDEWKLDHMKNSVDTIDLILKSLDGYAIATISSKMSTLAENVESVLVGMMSIKNDIQILIQDEKIRTLPRVEYAAFNTYKKNAPPPPQCHDGTRKEILEKIQRWGEGRDDQCIFWLGGMAGTGKSTIARSVAEVFHRRNRLGASFFFSRGQGRRAEADAFFPSLALGLASTVPGFAPYLSKHIPTYDSVGEKSLADQWECLILRPLLDFGMTFLSPLVLVVVIDALDECLSVKFVPEIVRLLSTARKLRMVQLRIFITSRREEHIIHSFEGISSTIMEELTIDSTQDGRTERDIAIYMTDELSKIGASLQRPHWPGKEHTKQLLNMSGRLFIAAATACRFLQDTKFPDEKLLLLLQNDATDEGSSTGAIDDMYSLVLEQAINQSPDRKILISYFQSIVGSIIVLREPFSLQALEQLLVIPCHYLELTLNNLCSVLIVPPDCHSPIEIFHLSFHDFLLNPLRCKDQDLYIDEKDRHRKLFQQCIDLLSRHLKRDVCRLGHPGTLALEVDRVTVDECLPHAVQYSCKYWAVHLQAAGITESDTDKILSFLKEHFLHWVEAVSLIRQMANAVTSINMLNGIVKHLPSSEFRDFVYDSRRFILYHQHTISGAPLQVYYCATLFSPTESPVRKQFFSLCPSWISKQPAMQDHWGEAEQVLEAHAGHIGGLTISHDGTRLASCSSNAKTVPIWNISTGQEEMRISIYSNEDGKATLGYPRGLAFSRDGSHLTVRFSWGIKAWELATGQVEIMRSYSTDVFVVLSTYGDKVALVMPDQIVIVDFTTGRSLYTWKVNAKKAQFSSDDSKIAVVLEHTVQVRNLATGESVNAAWSEGCIEALSKDFEIMALRKSENTIDICKVITSPSGGSLRDICSLVTHQSEEMWSDYQPLRDVHLSPNGALVAYTAQKAVTIWNTESGEIERILKGHSDPISAIAFSPCGSLLVSAGVSGTIRLWNIALQPTTSQWPQSSPRRNMALSHDGKVILSHSSDDLVTIQDVNSGRSVLELKGFPEIPTISNDGKQLAAVGRDGCLRIWDISSGQNPDDSHKEIGEIRNSSELDFSTASTTMLSFSDGSERRMIKSCDQEVEDMELDPCLSHVSFSIFSSDGSKVASACNWRLEDGSYISKIAVWTVATRKLEQIEQISSGLVDWLTALAFSHDSTRVASGSSRRRLNIWDINTGEKRELTCCEDYIYSLAFSPQDTRLASGSYGTIKIWNLATGKNEAVLDAHPNLVHTLAFNPDDPWDGLPLYAVDASGGWITYNRRKIIALPEEIQSDGSRMSYMTDMRGNTLALKGASGRISIFVFNGAPDFDLA